MKLAVIAGSGQLPLDIIKEAKNQGIFTASIIIDSYARKEDFRESNLVTSIKIGELGKLLDYLKSNNITHLIFAGKVDRPDFSSIIPDFEGAKLLTRIVKNKFLGDDNLLKCVLSYFEDKGYQILKASDILAPSRQEGGSLTVISPSAIDIKNIEAGLSAFQVLGALDIGQAIIVSGARIISVEGAEGTDNLIKRSKDYAGNDAVLIKLPKPNQDTRVDMPTIGPQTIEMMHNSCIKGIVINNEVIVLSRNETIDKANLLGIYIFVI